jgi:hypothetical protein
MRLWLALIFGAPWFLAGCAGHKSSAPPVAPGEASRHFAPLAGEKLIITPENGLLGKVAKVNMSGRFVILNFPVGHLPSLEQHLNVYRLGLKVGEVKVTGPQLDDNVVGDLINGEAQSGDEVRDR